MVMPMYPIGMGCISGNVPEYYKQRYGEGYEAFGSRPISGSYPYPIIKKPMPPQVKPNKLIAFLKKFFA